MMGNSLLVVGSSYALPPFSLRPTDGKPLRRAAPQETVLSSFMDMQSLLGGGPPDHMRNNGHTPSRGRSQAHEAPLRPSPTQYRETFAQIGLRDLGNSCAAWEKLYKRQKEQPERYKLTSLEKGMLKRVNANCQAMYGLAAELNLALVEYRGYMYTAFLDTQTARNYQGLQKMMSFVQRQDGITQASSSASMPFPRQ